MVKTLKILGVEIPVIVLDDLPPDEWGLLTVDATAGHASVYWNNGLLWTGTAEGELEFLAGKLQTRMKMSGKVLSLLT